LFQNKKKKTTTLESLVSLQNQSLSLPAAGKHSCKAAVTTATLKLWIKGRWAGLAPIPIALYVIGLNWNAQVNLYKRFKNPDNQGAYMRQPAFLVWVRKQGCPR